MFFGALLSAILSTASGALLAPTALFTENVVKPLFGEMSDKRFLLMLRIVLVLFTAGVLVFALNNTSTMYEMVQNAYKVTLVGAFVPLVCGIYWSRATTQGALRLGAGGPGGVGDLRGVLRRRRSCRPQMVGLFASALGMRGGLARARSSSATRAPAPTPGVDPPPAAFQPRLFRISSLSASGAAGRPA